MTGSRSTPSEILAFATELSNNAKLLLMLEAAHSECQCGPCRTLRFQGRTLARAAAEAAASRQNAPPESLKEAPGTPEADVEARALTPADVEVIQAALAAWRQRPPEDT